MKINVRRENNKVFGRFASIRILVDGTEHGKIKNNQEKQFEINKPTCNIQFLSSGCDSKTLRLQNEIETVVIYFDRKLDKDYMIIILGMVGMLFNLILTEVWSQLWGNMFIKLFTICFFVIFLVGGISANKKLKDKKNQCIKVESEYTSFSKFEQE